MRVLIVDDAEVERAALSRILTSLGHEIAGSAPDAAGALALAAGLRPDLAIVDGRLPPDGCLPAIEALRDVVPAMHVAVLASLGEIDVVRAAVANGASGALRRPVRRGEVEDALERMLPQA